MQRSSFWLNHPHEMQHSFTSVLCCLHWRCKIHPSSTRSSSNNVSRIISIETFFSPCILWVEFDKITLTHIPSYSRPHDNSAELWEGACCSVLQCVALCCIVLQCDAVCCRSNVRAVSTHCDILFFLPSNLSPPLPSPPPKRPPLPPFLLSFVGIWELYRLRGVS